MVSRFGLRKDLWCVLQTMWCVLTNTYGSRRAGAEDEEGADEGEHPGDAHLAVRRSTLLAIEEVSDAEVAQSRKTVLAGENYN